MGIFALALPVGTIAVLSPAAVAKAVQNPISCSSFSGTVTFGTPLTTAGVPTTSKTAINTVISGGTFTCTGGIPGNDGTRLIVLGAKNTKLAKTDSRYNKAAGIKYVTGTWSEFTASAKTFKKSLKQINFTIGGQPVQFKTKGASLVLFGVCGGDAGFKLSGQVKSGTYADKTASVTACLHNDNGGTSTNNFGADYTQAQGMTSAVIDSSVSVANL
jgi:hypothetical protein